MKLGRWVVALSVLCLPLATYADSFSGSASFSDTSSTHNNVYNYTGNFANPTFSFTEPVGNSYSDALTIDTNFLLGGIAPDDTVSVSVNFTEPSDAGSGFSGTGTFTFFGIFTNNQIDWTSNYQTVTFADGTVLQLYLPNFNYGVSIVGSYGSHTEDLIMTDMSETPEPSSLALFGTGLLLGIVGLGLRKARKSNGSQMAGSPSLA